MTAFAPSGHSHKTGACRRLADHIAAAAAAMGLVADVATSRQSASHYVFVVSRDDDERQIKIRCSDHADKSGGSDWYVWVGECPSGVIARLAGHFGTGVPAGYRPDDYAARSETAKAAAATREQARRATEADMAARVVEALRTAKSATSVAAGKVVDGLYPAIPRAQRQRIAYAVSHAVLRERAIAAAAGDDVALAKLACHYDDVRLALFNRVGAQRFSSLRPPGYPRSAWMAGL